MTVQVCTSSNVSNSCNRMFIMEVLFKLPFVLPAFEKKKKNSYLYKGKVNDYLKTYEKLKNCFFWSSYKESLIETF